jgi:hypothetical protein
LGVCAAILNVGIVGDGKDGIDPLTGWPEPEIITLFRRI